MVSVWSGRRGSNPRPFAWELAIDQLVRALAVHNRCRLLYAHLRFLLGQNHERPKFKVVGYGLGNSAAWTEICPVAQRGPMFSLRRGRRQAVWAGHERSPQLMRDDAILPPTLSSDRTQTHRSLSCFRPEMCPIVADGQQPKPSHFAEVPHYISTFTRTIRLGGPSRRGFR